MLTIYNQRFAVVRQKLPLDLKSDVNHVQVTDITGHLEPDSVILRSLDSGRRLQILEQNYRDGPVSQPLLLSPYEGKTRSFDNGSTFRATSIENASAPIEVITTTPPTKPTFTPAPQDGFTFTSDPNTTVTNFAQIVEEANGSLY